MDLAQPAGRWVFDRYARRGVRRVWGREQGLAHIQIRSERATADAWGEAPSIGLLTTVHGG